MDTWQKICEEWLGWSTERVKRFAEEKASARRAGPPPGEPSWGEGGSRFRPQRPEVKLGGLVGEMREVMTKKGSRMAFGQVEDLHGKLEVVFFPEAYASVQEILKRATSEAEAVLLTGELEVGDEAPKILAKSLEWLGETHKGKIQQVVLRLAPGEIRPDQLRKLKKSFLQNRRQYPIRIDFIDPGYRTRLELPKTVLVSGTPQMVQSVNRIFGRDVVFLA
jgi:DNA polymerase-3 subunit alpha